MKIFNNKILLCTLLFCIFTMTSCEKAPQTTEKQEEKEELISEQYVSLEEAKKQVIQLQGKNQEGFTFPEKIQMPDVQKVSEIKLTPWYPEKEEDLLKGIKNLWHDYDTVDWSAIEEKTFSNKKNAKYFGSEKEDPETGLLYSYDSSGFFSGDSLNDTELTSSHCIASYDFEWGDTAAEKDSYMLEDGELSVSDAVAYTENLFNQYMPGLEKGQFTYRVQHLYVMKDQDKDICDYNMVLGRVYQGVPIDTSSDFNITEGDSYEKNHCGIHIVAIMRHKNSLDYINTCNELIDVEATSEKDSIISPIWAVQQMNKEIAHDNGLKFDDCGLVYLLVQNNKLASKNRQDVYQGVSFATTYLRPVWLFLCDNIRNGFDTNTKDVHGTSVVVDALDGSIYYYQGTGAY